MSVFERFSLWISRWSSHPFGFIIAIFLIILWGFSGPFFNYSDTWQLVVNTTTTIITFLMVFLIQNAQSRESKAINLKIDELVRALDAADTDLLDLERRSQGDLEKLEKKYVRLAERAKAQKSKKKGGS